MVNASTPVVAQFPDPVVAWFPDHATPPTEGLQVYPPGATPLKYFLTAVTMPPLSLLHISPRTTATATVKKRIRRHVPC